MLDVEKTEQQKAEEKEPKIGVDTLTDDQRVEQANQVFNSPDEFTPEELLSMRTPSSEPSPGINTPGSEVDDIPSSKRGMDSSIELDRLQKQLAEIKPFLPVINQMRNDSGLVDTVRTYLKSGGEPPKSVIEQFKLDKEFVFDMDDAVKNPDSDSAKVFQHMINASARSMMTSGLKEFQQVQDAEHEEVELREKHKLSDKDFADFMRYADENTLTLEDIYTLRNLRQRDSNIQSSARRDVIDQMNRAKANDRTALPGGNAGFDPNDDDQVFDLIFKQRTESLFG